MALGEITGFVIFGPFLTLGAYMAQTGGSLEASTFIYSLPPGLLALAVIHTNNLRDSETDANARKITIANLIDLKASRLIYLSALLIAYGIIGILGIIHNGPHLILITFWTLPLLVVAINSIIHTEAPASFHTVMRGTLRIETYFILLLIVGLAIATLIPMLPRLPAYLFP
jgi:1,4-dihydroxy-2-naphthoate octaprenyltransferase